MIVGFLALDLALLGRGGGRPSFRRAGLWSVWWTLLGVLFAGVVWVWGGSASAGEYLAGLLIEKSLSIDNLFVFALIFASLAVPAAVEVRVLLFGIAAAIVLRALFIFGGAALLDALHWTLYLFGAFLVATGVRMATHRSETIQPQRNIALRALRRLMPVSREYHGPKLFVRVDGVRTATPVLVALVLVATFDVAFAVDSIPAIFAITRDTFIVFAANAFSLLGLASLFFLLLGMMERFRYLKYGLAAILVLIGTKMLVSDLYKVPIWLSLVAIVVPLGIALTASLPRTRDTPESAASPEGAAS
ncbi:MAG: TerC/Alx family metal homeostasis membrane protein [Gaiellaceae bacterium]